MKVPYEIYDDLANLSITSNSFYSASALPRRILSVCPSATFRYCIQMNEDTIVLFLASGRTIHLVSAEVKLIRYSQGITPAGTLK